MLEKLKLVEERYMEMEARAAQAVNEVDKWVRDVKRRSSFRSISQC